MVGTAPQHGRRLDSWKAIADYLGRDVRTAMRWAKDQGLPVGRVAGGKGRSVFAYTDEIDAWLKGHPASNDQLEVQSAEREIPGDAANGTHRRWLAAASVVVIAAAAALTASLVGAGSPAAFQFSVDQHGVHRSENGRGSLTIHRFDPAAGVKHLPRNSNELVIDLDADGNPDILAGISYFESSPTETPSSGELLRLDPDGRVLWRYAFDDTFTFSGERYSPPWALTDWRASPGPGRRRIAVAAHHFVWWPSIVAVLDDAGNRLGSFVNTGWIESVRWLDAGRLLLGGFNNPRDGAMVAVVDARTLSGRSPAADEPYVCSDCPHDAPLQYLVLPRSELNTLTAARFNRARVEVVADKVIVQTHETDGELAGGVAIYEFDLTMKLLRATYSDRYWDAHRKLAAERRIDHTVEKCPSRHGPPFYESWSADRGWRRIAIFREIPDP
jgi:hypothetical protein